MKVKELIEALQQFPSNLEVVVDGYEGGVDFPKLPCIIGIDRDMNTDWYYGRHDTNKESTDLVVYISR